MDFLGPCQRASPANATPLDVSPSPMAPRPPPEGALERPEPPESTAPPRHWLGLDRLGVLQVLGGIALGLIALFSSYVHITAFGRTVWLQQQWGILFIAASLATVVVDAELATGSRCRAADAAFRAAQDAARAENVAAGRRSRSSSRTKSCE